MRSPGHRLRALVGLVAAALLVLPIGVVSAAGPDATVPPPPVALENQANLDGLFDRLKTAADAGSAHQIEAQIWSVWLSPSDPDLRSMMAEVLGAEQSGDLPQAVQLLDKVVAAYPGYAEGWNQRATLYYMLGDYDDSLADCAKVLQLEPRHFGALSGRALIHLATGDRDSALKDITAALAIDPYLVERQLFPELPQQPATHI